MYDDLISALREIANSKGGSNINMPMLLTEAADAIEGLAHAVAQMTEWRKNPWIPVAERLPEVFKRVLVNIPGMSPFPTVQEAFREKNGMWYSNGFRYGADEITHWMPLPEPPKEE